MEIKEISIENELYPSKLREIKRPPKKLYVLGDETILNMESLSIIGSRCCTDYGAEKAEYFAMKLAQTGVAIVSGMAKGIDSRAHLGAIKAGGKTIAVLGSGLNHIFPDKKIFEEILKNGGAVITEYAEDVEIFPQGFRDRNRIVARFVSRSFNNRSKTEKWYRDYSRLCQEIWKTYILYTTCN